MKKRVHTFFISLVLVLSFYNALAQSDTTKSDNVKQPRKFTVKGYIKFLEEGTFAGDITQLETVNLLHNRLNFAYNPNKHLNLRLEIRNRIYYGELVQTYPGFASLETQSYGTFNLSENWVNKNAVLFNSTIDRASAEYTGGKWDILQQVGSVLTGV